MKYEGIQVTARARIESRRMDRVRFYPADIESPKSRRRPREQAELLARSMIDKWYERAVRRAARCQQKSPAHCG